jgi:hypothetical protein
VVIARRVGWPSWLHWTPEWAALLDPSQAAVCFVYREGRSSQWNEFEADGVAALVWLLHGALGDQLRNEVDPTTGRVKLASDRRYSHADFWSKGVGIVTPHRAQQALIVTKLQRLFQGQAATPAQIREAVDTVERFQGQQRDVMIATFALGDPDAIRHEDEFSYEPQPFQCHGVSRPRQTRRPRVPGSRESLATRSGRAKAVRSPQGICGDVLCQHSPDDSRSLGESHAQHCTGDVPVAIIDTIDNSAAL